MNIKSALKGQYHAGLAMLRQEITRCPAELWTSGAHPRNFWRIAYHAIFYTHLYLHPNEESFQAWEKHRANVAALWGTPEVEAPYTEEETLQYLDSVNAIVDEIVDGLDLDASETGFSWYNNIGKLEHQLMNLRHLQGHIGQLSELLMARDIDTEWCAK